MVSGTTGAVAVYPLSLVRTRLQAQGTPGHPTTYNGAFDVIRVTLQREGIRGFYKGLVPTLVKVNSLS
jgi:solute carrier family 25 phosphate transporter 23/24/25/41